MGGDTGRFREEVRRLLLDCGAVAAGFAKAGEVDREVVDAYDRWIAGGNNAGMGYMADYRGIRRDPRLLLEGASTVISMAFAYRCGAERDPNLPRIAAYALLPDYHKWIRKALRRSGVGELLGEEHKDWRICIDTAPIFERYWAREAGIAMIGKNGAAIVPGIGCEVFLAEIICRKEFAPDKPLKESCMACGKCMENCPTGALSPEGPDCNSCLSYLTIEHRGPLTDSRHKSAMETESGRDTLFGCDRCMSVCPHNRHDVRAIVDPVPAVLEYTGGTVPPGSCLKRSERLNCPRGRCC